MKILYAAGNRLGSYFQMERFLSSIKNQNHTIKLAAYRSSIGNTNVDYTLDCLLNFANPNANMSFNSNYTYYYKEIIRFAPDIIISDLEIYTSIIAIESKIKLWQASPVLLFYAFNSKLKNDIGIYRNYSYMFNANRGKKNYISYILNNSDKLFVLSHICDINDPPVLNNRYQWVRPEFVLSENIKTDYFIAAAKKSSTIIDKFKDKKSIIYAMDHNYVVNDCKFFISDGTETFLSDAFYNQKYCISYPRYDDIESIICSYTNEYYKLGSSQNIEQKPIHIKINDNIKFLSEHLQSI
jgi:hypothetical protein